MLAYAAVGAGDICNGDVDLCWRTAGECRMELVRLDRDRSQIADRNGLFIQAVSLNVELLKCLQGDF
jgi:hypothetical protein